MPELKRMRVRNTFSFLLGLLGLFSLTYGQLQLSTTTVDFGDVDEITPKTVTLGITNPSQASIQVTEVRTYTHQYGRDPFSTDKSTLTLAPGATDSLSITFSPMHNIEYNAEVMLVTDGPEGDLSVDVRGQGEYSIPYYAITQNSSEEDLKQSFQTLLTFGHVQMGYNPGRTEMFMVIDNQRVNGQGAAQNTLECVYTGTQVVGYTSRNDAQNQGFNTEHTFPQSLFGSQEPMVSDLHHLFPVTANSNTQRGNKPFGVVNNPSWQVGGSKSNGSTFEPRDAHKGIVARAMLYFYLRYGDLGNFFAPQENILVQWHNDFPPTAIDKKRNDDIDAAQYNRNPFIDYPQFIERISQFVGFSSPALVHNLDLSGNQIDFGTVTWGPHLAVEKTYTLVLVNHGNLLESITDFQTTVPGLTFARPLGDTTLLPGEALPITVKYTPTDSLPVNGFFSFRTTMPSMDSVSVAVAAGINYIPPPYIAEPGIRFPPGSNGPLTEAPVSAIFPNPGADALSIHDADLESGSAEVFIYNMGGQKFVEEAVEFDHWRADLDLEYLAEGLYFVIVRSGDTQKAYRYWVKR